jgi:hypothetical protein
MLKFSSIWRCASVAMVSKTIDDLPEPETPVKIVILRLGMRSETFFRLFFAGAANLDVFLGHGSSTF